jgi:hypothetical protein
MNPSHHTFRNIYIKGGGRHDAIVLGEYSTFQNVTVNGYQDNAVQALDGGRYSTFDACTFTQVTGSGIANYQDNLSIKNCKFNENYCGVSIASSADSTLVEGSTFGATFGWKPLYNAGTNTIIRNCLGL